MIDFTKKTITDFSRFGVDYLHPGARGPLWLIFFTLCFSLFSYVKARSHSVTGALHKSVVQLKV